MSEKAIVLDDLPPTWVLTTLGKVIDYGRTVKAEPTEFDDDDWILELEDIEKDTSRILSRATFADRRSKSTKNRFEVGDVLYGKLRPYLNKVLLADRSGYCTTEIVPLKSGSHLDPRFLFYGLKHPTFLAYVEAESHGMNMPRLGTETGRAAPFVLAPRAEQKRITDQLDAMLARVNACNDHFEGIPTTLKRFRQAVLASAISGTLTEEWRLPAGTDETCQVIRLGDDVVFVPSSWVVGTIADVVTPDRPLCYGVVQPGTEAVGGTPLIRVQDLARGRVLSKQLRTISGEVDAEYKRSKVSAGDLLVSVVGTIGRTAIVPDGLVANIARAIAKISCRSSVLSGWVNIWLSSDSLQWRLVSSSKEVARKTLNLSDLAATPVVIPKLDEQAEIVRRVESLFAIADRLESRCAAARAQMARLTPLLLAKAFRGELVPQDPNDEPASALLARIAAERTSAIPSPRTRTARRLTARASKENAVMTKSRQDDDVKGQPYLARHLRLLGGTASAEALFKASELPVADFYKQLAWEMAQGHVNDGQGVLEASDAA